MRLRWDGDVREGEGGCECECEYERDQMRGRVLLTQFVARSALHLTWANVSDPFVHFCLVLMKPVVVSSMHQRSFLSWSWLAETFSSSWMGNYLGRMEWNKQSLGLMVNIERAAKLLVCVEKHFSTLRLILEHFFTNRLCFKVVEQRMHLSRWYEILLEMLLKKLLELLVLK